MLASTQPGATPNAIDTAAVDATTTRAPRVTTSRRNHTLTPAETQLLVLDHQHHHHDLQVDHQHHEETIEMINSIIYLMAQTGSPPRLNISHAVYDDLARAEVEARAAKEEDDKQQPGSLDQGIALKDC